MRCVNHPETEVQAYCQHCGKALCAACVRTTPTGQIFCETCAAAGASVDPNQAPGQWQSVGQVPPGSVPPGQVPPFYPFAPSGPNPSAAAVLGLIPGVGAMYNGQLFKGLIHVVIFAVLVSITDHYAVFGIFIGAWVLYQSFEAYHTAKARRDGTPVPDPFGLNELGSWINLGSTTRFGGNPQAPPQGAPGQAPGPIPGQAATDPRPYTSSYTGSWSDVNPGPYGQPGGYPPSQPPYAEPYTGPDLYAGNYPPGYVPPVPPVPPQYWRRREPIFAVVLIGLGIIFLLQSLGWVHNMMHYIWPFLLIGLGIWLIVRRVGWSQGGSK